MKTLKTTDKLQPISCIYVYMYLFFLFITVTEVTAWLVVLPALLEISVQDMFLQPVRP